MNIRLKALKVRKDLNGILFSSSLHVIPNNVLKVPSLAIRIIVNTSFLVGIST